MALAAHGAGQEWWPGPTPADIVEAKLKERRVRRPGPQDIKKIEMAIPDAPPATPARPRKVLVWGRLWTHAGNAFAEEAVRIMGRKTGAFDVVVTDDPRLLLPENLGKFDALFLNNLHDQQPFLPPDWKTLPKDRLADAQEIDKAVKQSILAFVAEEGKGVAGVHGAIAALKKWSAFGEMMGAFHGGHWGGPQVLKLDDPDHPVNACFGGKPFRVSDESYVPGPPYSRRKLHVLLSLDLTQSTDPAEKAEWLKNVMKGRPRDYAISWVKPYGKGRVFYCCLGHSTNTYLNPLYLRHVLAGIQFVIGDLPGDATPSEK
jgi:type 1 glutamine amidotransferase